MTLEDLVRHFIEASISGASKTQVIRKFKETYNLDNNQLKKLQILASFKEKPKKINYKEFYKLTSLYNVFSCHSIFFR